MSELLPKRNPEQWKAFFAEGMAKKNRHYKIALNITQTELRRMQQFVIFNRGLYKNGLIIDKKIRREHPYKDLASLMLGMANEKKGYFFGLEGAYNDYLRGQNGRQLVRRIHHGGWIPVDSDDNTDAQNGDDVITTFDVKLQDIVESALNNTLTVAWIGVQDCLDGCVTKQQREHEPQRPSEHWHGSHPILESYDERRP